MDGGDRVGITLWVPETVSALRCGWQRQRRQQGCGWRRAKKASALHRGMQRQRWRRVVGGGDSIGVASWVVETAEMMALWVAEDKDKVGVALWVAETASASRHGQWRQCQHCIVGGRDDLGVALRVAETTLALCCGWQRQHWHRVVGGGDDVNRQRRQQQRGVRLAAAATGSCGGAMAASKE